MKKFLVLLLALMMLMSVTCSGLAESEIDITNGQPFMKYDETITLTVMASYSSSDGDVTQVTDGFWTQAYLEYFNIDLDYVYVGTSEEYTTRVNLMLMSGDIPDILTVDLDQLYQMVEADLIQPLDDLYDYGWISDQTYEAITQDGTFQLDISTVDGSRYAIPWSQPVTESVHAMFINNDWLDALGLDVPTTLEELEEVVYAFTYDDPDGNGIDDTYGFGLSQDLWDLGYEALSLANIMGAYPDYWIENEDGEIVYGSVQEEMRAVLEKLAQWYADGCIDPEFTVKDYTEEGDLVATNTVGLAFGVQWLWLMGGGLQDQYENMTEEERNETLGWSAYALPSYDGTTVTQPCAKDRTDGFLVVSSSCEHPEAAAIIANYIHYLGMGPQGEDPTEDGSRPDLVLEYGSEEDDESLTWENLWDEWTLNLYHPETIHDNLGRWEHVLEGLAEYEETGEVSEETQEWLDNNYLARGMLETFIAFEEYGQYMTEEINTATGENFTWENVLYYYGYICSGQTFEYAIEMRDSGNIVYDCIGAYVTETMAEVWSSLQDREIQVFTQIITGEADISAFDDFVEEWKSNGGDQITEEVNEWYDTYVRAASEDEEA